MAKKADAAQGKPPISILPFKALREVARAFAHGAKKYKRGDWKKGYQWTLYADSLGRHYGAWCDGEDIDPDSGVHHLACACADGLILLWYSLTGTGEDDRA